jgi:ribonuclease D
MGASADVAEDDGGASSDRGDGKVDRESRSDENERRVAPERVEVIASVSQLTELLSQLESVYRVAVDTEADSLHCYREKLCLLQVSLPRRDYIVDPLADVDLAPFCTALERKEIVLHGADFDLRLLRRGLNFTAQRIFDTVIGARLLGIREFSLAALVKRYFDVELGKGSQKANWARRPLSARMLEYAMNDTHYLLPLAERFEAQLKQFDRIDWLRQSCQRAVEQAAVERARDKDELWRIRGSGLLRGRAAAVLRALWQWREQEAKAADRPPFHVLQNHELINAAVGFASEKLPDYRHFSARRRQAFREAAQSALQLSEEEWPVWGRRFGTRPSPGMMARTEELRRRRDRGARELDLEPTFIASRSTLEAIAVDETCATTLLVPWQRELIGIKM